MAAFGQYLRGGAALNGFTLADIVTLASGAKGEDASGYRAAGTGHHQTTIRLLPELLGHHHAELSRYLDSCRIKRNITAAPQTISS